MARAPEVPAAKRDLLARMRQCESCAERREKLRQAVRVVTRPFVRRTPRR